MRNATLTGIILAYSLKPRREYQAEVQGLSKDTVISSLTDLLTEYVNDKNSSSLREFLTVRMAGYEHSTEKVGYNGYRHDRAGKPVYCEAKPKNVPASSERAKRKLNGSGNFTDYTRERFEKSLRQNPYMLVSGFIGGKIAYLLGFPFCDEDFTLRLRDQLDKHYEKLKPGTRGVFLRSAHFSFKDFINSPNLKVFHADLDFLRKNEHVVSKTFLKSLDQAVGGQNVIWGGDR